MVKQPKNPQDSRGGRIRKDSLDLTLPAPPTNAGGSAAPVWKTGGALAADSQMCFAWKDLSAVHQAAALQLGWADDLWYGGGMLSL